MELQEREIFEILEAITGLKITPVTQFKDMDSIDLMEIAMSIELHLGVKLTGSEIAGLENIENLIKKLKGH